ncbi:MAG TPA: ABC transporter permease [Anaerolineae bacterium]|nr:ABC transporter permease [Anaerolineae bacterium]HQK13363.1 ABC transporter permease [Anaerolineae bacterium]
MTLEPQVEKLDAEALLTPEKESQFSVVWRRFRRHKLAVAGLSVIILFVLMAIFANVVAPYDPISYQDPYAKNSPPSAQHILGTDEIGRDVFSRLLYAARVSLAVSFVVTIASELLGAIIGGVSGYFGGWVDNTIQRVVDFLLTIPLLPLLLAFSSLLRGITIPGVPDQWASVVIISVILIVFGWMGTCRLVRGMVLSLRALDFSEAARALGMSDGRIILRHMIPNAMAPIIVSATLSLGGVIVLESALSFLGFGIQPPVPTWGNMLQAAQQGMLGQPAKVFYPGLAIFLTSLAFNYVGDGLRDALDPRLKL